MSFGESDISREARVVLYDKPQRTGGTTVYGGIKYSNFSRHRWPKYLAPSSDSYGIQVTAAGEDALARAEQMLEGIPNGIERALSSAINRAAAHLRSASTKAARERYAISAANIRAEETVSVAYTYQNGVQAYVHFAGDRIPLYRFDGAAPAQPTYDTSRWVPVMLGTLANGEGRWRMVHPGAPAYGHVLRSTSPRQFQNAFVAKMSNGHTGIFERTGGMTSSDLDEIEELYGPSVPQMLGNREVAEKLAEETMQSFEKNLDQYVYALLNGYVSVR